MARGVPIAWNQRPGRGLPTGLTPQEVAKAREEHKARKEAALAAAAEHDALVGVPDLVRGGVFGEVEPEVEPEVESEAKKKDKAKDKPDVSTDPAEHWPEGVQLPGQISMADKKADMIATATAMGIVVQETWTKADLLAAIHGG